VLGSVCIAPPIASSVEDSPAEDCSVEDSSGMDSPVTVSPVTNSPAADSVENSPAEESVEDSPAKDCSEEDSSVTDSPGADSVDDSSVAEFPDEDSPAADSVDDSPVVEFPEENSPAADSVADSSAEDSPAEDSVKASSVVAPDREVKLCDSVEVSSSDSVSDVDCELVSSEPKFPLVGGVDDPVVSDSNVVLDSSEDPDPSLSSEPETVDVPDSGVTVMFISVEVSVSVSSLVTDESSVVLMIFSVLDSDGFSVALIPSEDPDPVSSSGLLSSKLITVSVFDSTGVSDSDSSNEGMLVVVRVDGSVDDADSGASGESVNISSIDPDPSTDSFIGINSDSVTLSVLGGNSVTSPELSSNIGFKDVIASSSELDSLSIDGVLVEDTVIDDSVPVSWLVVVTSSVEETTVDSVIDDMSVSFSVELEFESEVSSIAPDPESDPSDCCSPDSTKFAGDAVVACDAVSTSKGFPVDPVTDSSSTNPSTLSSEPGDCVADGDMGVVNWGPSGMGVISPSHSNTGQQRPGSIT